MPIRTEPSPTGTTTISDGAVLIIFFAIGNTI